jgi:SAM-dependent methyltransferase
MNRTDGTALPGWAAGVLACPRTHETLIAAGDRLVAPDGRAVAELRGGIARFGVPEHDSGIDFYRAVGGPHFHERSTVPYAMSSLETPLYHTYLAAFRPSDLDLPIVDVGGGDGRNALPWLGWGHRRVIVIDAAGAALERLHARVAQDHPDWLERLLLIEGDARDMPLVDACAGRVLALETLYYLNDDYEQGLRECARLLGPEARLMISERDYEAGLLTRLLYGGGIAGLLAQADTRDVWDGNPQMRVRSRSFSADELVTLARQQGLRVVAEHGIPILSLILGYLRSTDRLDADDATRLPEIQALLRRLGKTGSMRRCHILIAERA